MYWHFTNFTAPRDNSLLWKHIVFIFLRFSFVIDMYIARTNSIKEKNYLARSYMKHFKMSALIITSNRIDVHFILLNIHSYIKKLSQVFSMNTTIQAFN